MTNMKSDIAFFDHCFDKGRLKKWITKIYFDTTVTEDLTLLNFIEKLKNIGFEQATRAGVSIGIDDLKIPPKKAHLLKSIEYNIEETTREFGMNRITALENFQNFIDIWHRTSETLKTEVVSNFESTDTLNPVYMMAFSGARGNLSQVSQLVGMRGFMSDPEGQIIDYPIRSNFREGLTLTEYVISCYGARKGLVDTALRTADAGYLTRRLVDVAHHVIITKFDCKTQQGVWLTHIQDNNKVLYSLEKRLIGRVLASNIYFPYLTDETEEENKIFWSYFGRNQQLDPARAKLLATFFKKVLIRSPLRCLKRKRLCQLCYGWTLPHAQLAPIGEAIGILAAQSIGEPGTQLTMRTFHTGGVFSGALSDEIRAPYSGILKYNKPLNGAIFRSVSGTLAFLTKEPGILKITPTNTLNQELETKVFELDFPKFSTLFFKNTEKISTGDVLIEFPKQNESDKETVFNTYTYYSKSSGILEVYKTLSDSSTNIGIMNHPKLPKLHPFFEQQKYKNKKFQTFQISSGQLYQTNTSESLLVKAGDLVNTNTLFNLTQLINAHTGIQTQLKKQKKSLNKSLACQSLFSQKQLYILPLQSIFYNSRIGYTVTISTSLINRLNQKLILTLPYLNQQIALPTLQKTATISNSPSFKNGKLFSPVEDLNKPVSINSLEYEKLILKSKTQTPLKRSLTSFRKPTQSWIEFHNNLANICFHVAEPKFFNLMILSKQNIKQQPSQIKIGKQIGTLLSNYKDHKVQKIKQQPPTSQNQNWISRHHILTEQLNLQNKKKYIYPQNDGFRYTKSLVAKKSLPLKRQFARTLNLNYWNRSQMHVLKTGWPYFSLSNKAVVKLHQKYFLFGEPVFDQIQFPSICVYTEWIYLAPNTNSGLKLFKNRTKTISKSNNVKSFLNPASNVFILLFSLANDYSQFDWQSIKLLNSYKHLLTNNSQITLWKQLLQIRLTRFNVKDRNNKLTNLFTDLNKVISTSTRVRELANNITRLELTSFQNSKYLNKVNSLKISQTHEKIHVSSPIKPIQLIFKVENQHYFDSLKGFVNKTNLISSSYSYYLNQNLGRQTYFKNGLSNPANFNLVKNRTLIKGNSPIIQSHFRSPFMGELIDLQSTVLPRSANALIVTDQDTFTLKLSNKNVNFQIGDNIFYGQQITSTQLIPYAGKVTQVDSHNVKFQFIETSLVSPNSHFFAENQQLISKTTRLFTQPYPRLQMGDIVQGIPKIEEFFEARQTKEGEIFEGNLHDRLKTRFAFYRKKYRYPLFIATRKSIFEIQNYIIESIFKLYNSQGISISDKHLEIIVRQMTSRVMVTDFWIKGTPLIPWKHPLPYELYSQRSMEQFLVRTKNTHYENICYEPVVLGITKAALETGGFISAASFQETTRILSNGAVFQKRDHLKGLKENVILGHIIPAGTAVRTYSRRYKGPIMASKFKQQGLQVLTVNYNWQLKCVNKKTTNTQYFNPIRLVLIRMLLLAYFQVL